MQKPKSVLENEMLKILWEFEIQRGRNIEIVNRKKKKKEKKRERESADLWSLLLRWTTERKSKKTKRNDPARELKKLWNCDSIYNWCTRNGHRFSTAWGSISLVKDVNCLITYTGDLFVVVKVCAEPATLSGWAENRRMVHQCVTDSQQHEDPSVWSKMSTVWLPTQVICL